MFRRATARAGSRQGGRRGLLEPGITAALSRMILRELGRRGLPSDRLLERSGLTREQVMDPDGWIPLRAHAAFFREAAAASGDPAFAWDVGRATPPEVLGPVGSAITVSATMREALETWTRYFHHHVDGARLFVRSTPALDAIGWELPPSFPPVHENCLSFASSLLAEMERSLGPVRPLGIDVTAAEPADPRAVESVVGGPIRWGADRFELRLPAGTLDQPLAVHNPAFRKRLVQIAEQVDAGLARDDVARRLRAAILQEGFERTREIAQVANLLGTTPRTLQRWLRKEGRSFTSVRGEALAHLVRRFLSQEAMPVAVAARRLGFSSRAAFHRAVKRWTGRTPREIARGSTW